MSEPTTEPTPTEPTEPAAQGDPADEPLGEGGKKALQAERERAKELEKQLSAATSKLTEIERANETAIEKAQREAQEARAEVEQVPQKVADRLRDYLADINGISEEHKALYLTSNDPETLLKQAAGLAERTPTAPKPDLSQGGKGDTSPGTTASQFAAAIEGALT